MELLLQSLLPPLVILHTRHHALRLPAHPRARGGLEAERPDPGWLPGPVALRDAHL
jgi:hypothetical protein